jgi:hypothetical protein
MLLRINYTNGYPMTLNVAVMMALACRFLHSKDLDTIYMPFYPIAVYC